MFGTSTPLAMSLEPKVNSLLMLEPEFIGTAEEIERAAKKMKKSTAVAIPDPGFPDDNNKDDGD
jgi:hypothetical protein